MSASTTVSGWWEDVERRLERVGFWCELMIKRLKRSIDGLGNEMEFYLIVSLFGVTIFLLLLLICCSFATSACRCCGRRQCSETHYRSDQLNKRNRRDVDDEEKRSDLDYFRTIEKLLERKETVEREWEERKKIREEYRIVSPPISTELGQSSTLSDRRRSCSSIQKPQRPRVKRTRSVSTGTQTIQIPRLISDPDDLKTSLERLHVDHRIQIHPNSKVTRSTSLLRRSWVGLIDETEVGGGSTVIVRRFEPLPLPELPNDESNKRQLLDNRSGIAKAKRVRIETVV